MLESIWVGEGEFLVRGVGVGNVSRFDLGGSFIGGYENLKFLNLKIY